MDTKQSHIVLLLIGLCLSVPAAIGQSPSLMELWRLSESLSRPESVVYDATQDLLYVSNINGNGTAKDGNGYITKVSLQGKVLDKHWAGGLNAPKGLALFQGALYVADIDALVVIDTRTGQTKQRHIAKGAQFLNDVAIDVAGNVYISDTRMNCVYRLHGDKLTVWLKAGALLSPNGLFVKDRTLLVAAADTQASTPGNSRYLHTVSLQSQKIQALVNSTPVGGLDAIEADNSGGYFLSDWRAGKVMHFSKGGSVKSYV